MRAEGGIQSLLVIPDSDRESSSSFVVVRVAKQSQRFKGQDKE
ncbi:MAG: hypothetical protein PHW12_08440 [Smithella sp.]|nr:hypothetical protein [Smithella sp.]